jgi:protein tyrosine phosphatase (PTP) superfamily phosphohydrolase (DUF442 family)
LGAAPRTLENATFVINDPRDRSTTSPLFRQIAHARRVQCHESIARMTSNPDQMNKWQRMRAFWLSDHAIIRKALPNIYKIDDDIIRGGHPDAARLEKLKKAGVKSILNLRGDFDTIANGIEKRACDALDLKLSFVALRATALPGRSALLETIERLQDLPRPIFIHCKSGADRTALALVLYLVTFKGIDIKAARRTAFKFKYGHIRWSRARILHDFLDAFEHAAEKSGITLADWIAQEYDPKLIAIRR